MSNEVMPTSLEVCSTLRQAPTTRLSIFSSEGFPAMPDSDRSPLSCSFLSTVFVLVLLVPLIGFCLNCDQKESLAEKRLLAPLPPVPESLNQLRVYPQKLEGYFNDRFGFREMLVQWYGQLSLTLGAVASNKVVLGKEGWLFFVKKEEKIIEGFRNTDPLTPEELEAWRADLQAKQQWLQGLGIPYMFVIAPDKHTIYPEYFPSHIRRVGPASRCDQLLAYMNAYSDVVVLDLRPALLAAKQHALIFYKRDTHWNAIGANVTQYEIARLLHTWFPQIQPRCLEDGQFFWKDGYVGDMSTMIGLNALAEPQPRIADQFVLPLELVEHSPKKAVLRMNGNSSLRALVVGDSFASTWVDYLPQYFQKTTFVWEHLGFNAMQRCVEQEQPGVVIEERVERSLCNVPGPCVAALGADSTASGRNPGDR